MSQRSVALTRLGELDPALQADVERHPARAAQDVATGVAERARRHQLEGGLVEPLLDRLRRLPDRRSDSAALSAPGPTLLVPCVTVNGRPERALKMPLTSQSPRIWLAEAILQHRLALRRTAAPR